ncbi:uncharacterized protein EAF01_007039 [Botrytis porri]|uniref:Uncharacterized protein n=1 Tax=Botrytis porri TaxID=87229 RepID=A0A4Z1KSQ1_9HELO|nr:uncharacterized protein EAF01_007039 [Botrytis porri]KAF7901740.1 hypothetical protein EAF01_007039 [Botrytis porri]TGO86155.1 hypothetical protein BPOR_0329g00020 [Botrytis porri]
MSREVYHLEKPSAAVSDDFGRHLLFRGTLLSEDNAIKRLIVSNTASEDIAIERLRVRNTARVKSSLKGSDRAANIIDFPIKAAAGSSGVIIERQIYAACYSLQDSLEGWNDAVIGYEGAPWHGFFFCFVKKSFDSGRPPAHGWRDVSLVTSRGDIKLSTLFLSVVIPHPKAWKSVSGVDFCIHKAVNKVLRTSRFSDHFNLFIE